MRTLPFAGLMKGVTIGAAGNAEWIQGLGKKSSTESDIQLVTFKEGDTNVSIVLPIRFPEKVQPLAYVSLAADAGLLVVPAVTKEIGEAVLAFDAAGVERGAIVLQNYLQPEQVAPVLKGTTLEKWTFVPEDKQAQLRETLASFAQGVKEGPFRIPIDHHFDVKGIGAVILGFVKQGVVKKHDPFRLYPTKKTAQVKSIQVHDVDVEQAVTCEHVGLAIKGAEAKDLDRGYVLAPDGTLEVMEEKRSFKLEVGVSRFYKQGVDNGRVYFLAMGMQIIPVKVKTGLGVPGSTAHLEVETQKPFTFAKGEHGIFLDVDSKGSRVIGRARVE